MVVHYHLGRDRAEALAAELGGAPVLGADLTDEAQVDALFEAAGPLRACAAVAGVWPREDVPVWELSLARWEETLRANLTATFLTARGFLRQGGRSLVLVGSTAGLFGEAGHADYAAAKAAILHGLLPSLKNEATRIAPDARVNAVAPGWTESPMTRGLVDPEAVARVSRTMALRKVARPEDVAAQVVALTSETDLGPRHRPDRDRGRRHGGTRRPRVVTLSPVKGWSPSSRSRSWLSASPGRLGGPCPGRHRREAAPLRLRRAVGQGVGPAPPGAAAARAARQVHPLPGRRGPSPATPSSPPEREQSARRSTSRACPSATRSRSRSISPSGPGWEHQRLDQVTHAVWTGTRWAWFLAPATSPPTAPGAAPPRERNGGPRPAAPSTPYRRNGCRQSRAEESFP